MTNPTSGTPDSSAPKTQEPLLEAAQALKDLAAQRLAQAAVTARELITKAKSALRSAMSGWHEAGLCMQQLQQPLLAKSLGYTSYYEMCRKELSLGPSTVSKMLRVTKALPKDQCADLGLDRADALLRLAKHSPDAKLDAILAGGAIELWAGGPRLDVGTATLAQVGEAARTARAHRAELAAATPSKEAPPSQDRRGRTVSATDRALVAHTNHRLREHGSRGQARAKATNPGQPARFSLERLRRDEFEIVTAALLAAPQLGVVEARKPA